MNQPCKWAWWLDRFLLRGLEKVNGEWGLIASTHNLFIFFRATLERARVKDRIPGTPLRTGSQGPWEKDSLLHQKLQDAMGSSLPVWPVLVCKR